MSKNLSWYRAVTQEDSVNAVAKRAGLVQTTLAAQVRKGELTPQSVVAIARAYQSDPLSALVAVGFLTDEEVTAYAHRAALGDASDEDLAREVWLRMSSGSASEPITAPEPPLSMQELRQRRLRADAMPVEEAADDRPRADDDDDWEPR